MSMDPYALCPCGSGKKVKFCCLDIVEDMSKVERLVDNNQPRMALQQLEKLDKTHPDNPWIITNRALALIQDDRSDEARSLLGGLLKHHPDHPFANALYGLACLQSEGYPKCKRGIHRAFVRGIGHHPAIVGMLAMHLASHHIEAGHHLAGRQHLALALRIGDDEQRKQSFLTLLEFDGDTTVPFLLRGVHSLPDYPGNAATHDAAAKAHRLMMVGCFQEAADALRQVAEQDAESAPLWHTLGLLQAWDGDDEPAAAESLHRAARLYSNFDTAVECESLAQLLELYAPDRAVRVRTLRYRVESVSRLLGQLDQDAHLVRLADRPAEQTDEVEPVARYLILDRPLTPNEPLETLTRESAPLYTARLTIFDRGGSPDLPAMLYLSSQEGAIIDSATERLRMAAGDLISAEPPASDATDHDVTALIPREQLPLHWNYYFPPKTPGHIRRRLEREHWNAILQDIWPTTPQQALGGLTPLAAVDKPELQVPLAAAINVLDVFCEERTYVLPAAEIRARLHVAAPASVPLADGDNLSAISLWRLRHLDLAALSPEHFRHVLQRAILVRHAGYTYDVLQEYLRRDIPDSDSMQRQQAIATLSEICRQTLRGDEALAWIARGREAAAHQEHAFENVLQWKMRELTFRLEDVQDPEVGKLLHDLWQTYGAKLPTLRQRLVELVTALGINPPWESAIVTPQTVAAGGGAVWSPAGAPTQPAGERKLWLPGQQ